MICRRDFKRLAIPSQNTLYTVSFRVRLYCSLMIWWAFILALEATEACMRQLLMSLGCVVIVCYIHTFADITSFAGQVPCTACGPGLSHSRSPLSPFPHYTCVQNMNYFQMRCSKFAFTYKSQLTLNTAVNGSYAVRYGHWSARQAACVIRKQDFRRVYSVRGAASLIPW
jgi:hypothetical protein